MEHEVALRESAHRRLIDAIEGTPEAVLLTDAEDRIIVCNSQIAGFLPTIADLFQPGLKAGEAIAVAEKKGLFELEASDPYPVLGAGNHMTTEHKLVDGRWLRVSRSRTRDGGSVAFWSDITATKSRETQLEQARDEAEAANRAKGEFLANMSHELRTPLNAVIGFADIIAQQMHGPVGDEQYVAYADQILEGGRHLLSVINDLLDIAKSEARTLKIKPAPSDIGAIVEACRRMVQEQCRDKDLDLDVDLPSELPLAEVDPGRIRQVVLNLLSNAVKFTPAGGRIDVACGIRERRIFIRVADTGIGMREDEIPVALAPFGQIDSSLSRDHEGTGLGLPLSRTLVELHGGEMTVRSAPGKGTEITIFLPLTGMAEPDPNLATAMAETWPA
jgi:two-component system cell cycle sensor histidine kinase PleC